MKKKQPQATGVKKLKVTETEEKKAAPPPTKPNVSEETRLFQITLKGEHPETGKPMIHGTEKKWLIKEQAEAHGFHWKDDD